MIGGCCLYCQVHGLQSSCDVTDKENLDIEDDKERQMKISQLLYRLERESVPLIGNLQWENVALCGYVGIWVFTATKAWLTLTSFL